MATFLALNAFETAPAAVVVASAAHCTPLPSIEIASRPVYSSRKPGRAFQPVRKASWGEVSA